MSFQDFDSIESAVFNAETEAGMSASTPSFSAHSEKRSATRYKPSWIPNTSVGFDRKQSLLRRIIKNQQMMILAGAVKTH